MQGFDLSKYLAGVSLGPLVAPGATRGRIATVNGSGVDCHEAPDELNAVVITGTHYDGTHTITLTESDSDTAGGTWTAVAKAGTFTEISALGQNKVEVVQFKRSKRYVRANSTVADATSGSLYDVLIVAPKKFDQ